ncbi:ecdysteroid 22-kinase family protein [Nocardioides sp. W7]|uniref:ecdysteroid 22-kinase family protein n=1 Tax=Nocardioides sp. W7 TaxID=2931390 RepID=UPI001FD4FD9B|nr:ecdysteroid 22-kinase family protein [Nocardioides sp. W7]
MSIPALIEELTPAWLSEALGGRVTAVRSEPVGTGQIGTCHRLHLEGEGVPETVLAKLPAVDPAARELLAGVYRTETLFYTEVAPTVAIRVPTCHHAEMSRDSGAFVLLLEDLAPAVQGDQLGGCTVDQARDAAVNLAGLHGPRWCDPTLLDLDGVTLTDAEGATLLAELYGPATDIFLDGLGTLLAPEDHDTLRDCVAVTEQWTLARGERFGLVHGDYRLDNLLFPPDGGPGSVAVDWQTLSLGLPARDLAYVLGTGLPVEDRRAHERDLVASYHSALVGHGAASYSAEQAWGDYRFAMLQGPLVSVFGCAYGTRTERGDRMFAAMVTRSCAAIRDLRSIELAGG